MERPVFHNTNHLPQLFRPDHYFSPEQYEAEKKHLFAEAWHIVGLTSDVGDNGSFITLTLYYRPLIFWQIDGRIRAFLNVCTHRFSTLTDKPKGKEPTRLRCQYHGWEYDHDGNTCKIPDAQSFRPLKKGELGLREYAVATVGQLLFVNFSENPQPIEEFLGPELTELSQKWFTQDHRTTLITKFDLDCNWKIVVENVLESYHIGAVHPSTFKEFPEPQYCRHEFHPTYDHYIHDYRDDPGHDRRGENIMAKLAGVDPEMKWHHILRYPNLIYGGAGPYHYVQTVYPTSPNTCVARTWMLHFPGAKPGVWTFLIHRLMKRIGSWFSMKVQLEDAAIYPKIHRGTTAVDRPHSGGLISVREERVFAFQKYILRETGNSPTAADPADQDPFPPTVRFAQ